jgi:hypothetical protein
MVLHPLVAEGMVSPLEFTKGKVRPGKEIPVQFDTASPLTFHLFLLRI